MLSTCAAIKLWPKNRFQLLRISPIAFDGITCFAQPDFAPFPALGGYVDYKDENAFDATDADWSSVSAPDQDNGWRIDGAMFGIKYNAIPVSLSPLAPSRIDVSIPDQTEWSPDTWRILGAKDSVHMSGIHIRTLGIANNLCRALEHWSSSIPTFWEYYRKLPFGSNIIVSNVEADVTRMQIAFKPNDLLWDRLLSVEALRSMWKDDGVELPPAIDYRQLRYEKQLSQDVTLVTVPTPAGSQLMIFKSQTKSCSELYHEVKMLLSLPRSAYIAEPPAYLATTNKSHPNDSRACGFLMKYYELDTLYTILPQRRREGTLALDQQIQWAKDITSALMHVISVPGNFYSDLRTDNIVLSTKSDGSETTVLIDFEQGRNVYNWAPREIYYMEWMAELGYADLSWSDAVKEETRLKYSTLLERFLSIRQHPTTFQGPPERYDNPPHGWYYPWLASTPQEQEACEVYLLGKALYCLFEGLADHSITLGRSTTNEGEQLFPEYRHTPLPLQDLIKQCTAGAREWKDGPMKITRCGGKVFPLGITGMNGEMEATFEETKAAIKEFWQNEMKKAEAFISAKGRYESGEADDNDLELLDYLRRPKLAHVLDTLESFRMSLS